MTKQDIVTNLSSKAGITKKAATMVYDAFLDLIKGELKKGSSVTLTGFGTFSVGKRKARVGRNPQTGAEIQIKASRVPRFKAGQALKNLVK